MSCSIRCPNCGQEFEPTPPDGDEGPRLEPGAEDPIKLEPPGQVGSDSDDGLMAASPDPFLDMLGADANEAVRPDSPLQVREGESIDEIPGGSGSFLTKLLPAARPNFELHSDAGAPPPGEPFIEGPSTPTSPSTARDLDLADGCHGVSKLEDRSGRDETGALASTSPQLTVLLASYASAVSIALIWFVWNGWSRPQADETLAPSSRIEADRGNEAALLGSLPGLSPERIINLHRSLQVGDLEITPLAVEHGPIRLWSATGGRREEADVLTLRLRLRHSGSGGSFVPLEPAFVREPDRGMPETMIEAGGRVILNFPLAFQSEWAIEGESFDALEPGEVREVLLASEPGAGSKLAPEMTWRLRLRVAEGRTELLGIRFRLADLAQ